MSRGNTPALPPGPSDWLAKYAAETRRELALHRASIERRRAAGMLTIGESQSIAENAAWDAAEWAIDNDEPNGGDDNFRWGYDL